MPSIRASSASLVVVGSLAGLLLACAGGSVDEGRDDELASAGTSGTGDGDGDGDGDGSSDGPIDADFPCGSVGCACAGDSCDAPLVCVEGTCGSASCGDGVVESPAEDCDDANAIDGDGCDSDCSFTTVAQVAAGAAHTCALIEGGRVRCWGLGEVGQLGYGNPDNVGDNEPPASAGDVALAEPVTQLSVGARHACALLASGGVRCWGENGSGQLGLGNTVSIGDDELPDTVPTISINAAVLDVEAGGAHSCMRVTGGNVRCWGSATFGQLGYGNTTPLPVPLTVDVQLGNNAAQLRAGGDHNCGLLAAGEVRCWGRNDRGQLGYGNVEAIGDTELPSDVVAVPMDPQGLAPGTAVAELALGETHSCARFETGDVLCWGENFYGQLGQGSTTTIGDNETLATLFPIELGASASALALGKHHTCALLDDGEVLCWGRNLYGQLGRGDIAHLGDDETLAAIEPIELGGPASSITAGDYHTCAVVDDHDVVCWGFNDYGQLGYADTELRGDDEFPAELGPIELLGAGE